MPRRKGRIKRLISHFSTPKTDQEKKIQRTTLSIELFWSFFQFYLVLLISGAIATSVQIHFFESFGPWVQNISEAVVYVFFQLAFLHYMLKEQGKKFNCNFDDFMKLLGVRGFKWSMMGSYMMLYHIAVFGGLLYLQYSEDDYYFTFAGYFPLGMFNLRRAISLVILTPIREEIYFRGCVFTTALHRSEYLSIPILLTGLMFGGAHLMNLFRPSVSYLYISLQVISGLIVGIFYCLRFLVTGTLWESILLHMVNNVTSSFLPVGDEFDFANPKIGLPMTCTLFLYAIMSYFSLQQLKTHKIWGQCFKEKLDNVRHPFERLQEMTLPESIDDGIAEAKENRDEPNALKQD